MTYLKHILHALLGGLLFFLLAPTPFPFLLQGTLQLQALSTQDSLEDALYEESQRLKDP